MTNTRNLQDNPHKVLQSNFQHRFSVNVVWKIGQLSLSSTFHQGAFNSWRMNYSFV